MVISWGKGTSGMAMNSRMYSMLAILPTATCMVEAVMKSRFKPKYQSITFFSFPLENWLGIFLIFFLVPLCINSEALGQ